LIAFFDGKMAQVKTSIKEYQYSLQSRNVGQVSSSPVNKNKFHLHLVRFFINQSGA
jgi:hypothetical protein